jgi:hypothetical protein
MLRHAFRFVDSVIFVIGPTNVRSRRAVERIGGVFDGTAERNGKDRVIYRIRKGDPSVATAPEPH